MGLIGLGDKDWEVRHWRDFEDEVPPLLDGAVRDESPDDLHGVSERFGEWIDPFAAQAQEDVRRIDQDVAGRPPQMMNPSVERGAPISVR